MMVLCSPNMSYGHSHQYEEIKNDTLNFFRYSSWLGFVLVTTLGESTSLGFFATEGHCAIDFSTSPVAIFCAGPVYSGRRACHVRTIHPSAKIQARDSSCGDHAFCSPSSVTDPFIGSREHEGWGKAVKL